MRRVLWTLVVLLAIAAIVVVVTKGIGFTSRRVPAAIEVTVMTSARNWAIPSAMRAKANPVPATQDVIRLGMSHFADHCSICHANTGSGSTLIGQSLFPPAPDMREPRTQGLTDGELFYIIEHGVPFTGMPAWSNGTPEGETASWTLVRFIRHLPQLTEKEMNDMEKLNPKSEGQKEEDRRINDFLKGRGGT
jgi:mono/diheme cytochrome c family protein